MFPDEMSMLFRVNGIHVFQRLTNVAEFVVISLDERGIMGEMLCDRFKLSLDDYYEFAGTAKYLLAKKTLKRMLYNEFLDMSCCMDIGSPVLFHGIQVEKELAYR